jgi:hypothetical protein
MGMNHACPGFDTRHTFSDNLLRGDGNVWLQLSGPGAVERDFNPGLLRHVVIPPFNVTDVSPYGPLLLLSPTYPYYICSGSLVAAVGCNGLVRAFTPALLRMIWKMITGLTRLLPLAPYWLPASSVQNRPYHYRLVIALTDAARILLSSRLLLPDAQDAGSGRFLAG